MRMGQRRMRASREEVCWVECEQLVHDIGRHVALHDEDDQSSQQAQDACSTPLAQVLRPAHDTTPVKTYGELAHAHDRASEHPQR